MFGHMILLSTLGANFAMENKSYFWLKTPFQALLFRDPAPDIYSGCVRRNSKITIA
jgi:hypothetical protein